MNTNTLKAALVEFTGSKVKVITAVQFEALKARAPAMAQDVMNVEKCPVIVNRVYGGGEEAFHVRAFADSTDNYFMVV